MKYLRRMLMGLMIGLFCVCAQARALTVLVPFAGGDTPIHATEIEEENWLFLPSGVDLETLCRADGTPLGAVADEEDGVYTVESGDETVYVMRSEHIRSLFLFSSDPENEGRAYIDGGERHNTFTQADMALVDAQGEVNHVCHISKLRGRGNGTWSEMKKPYQIKLEEKADLLEIGQPARTWVLLAMARDATFLHDSLTFEMARMLGEERASGSEHVNLYYDGEYRGLYLLCEKTEIGENRIDELDYDKLMKAWNEQIGQHDLAALPVAEGVNRFGNEFTYIQNAADNDDLGAGAYLVEMESPLTLSERCWFKLSTGDVLSVKNPENASERMMRYISERLQEARNTLVSHGVNPETGRTLADDFDVDAFARSILVSELSGNVDSYLYSSTYFVLPAGETRFEPSPPWDYDLAYAYYSLPTAFGNTAHRFRDRTGWIPDFLSCPEFSALFQQLCQEEVPALTERLLALVDQAYTRLYAAQRMDDVIWDVALDRRMNYGADFDESIALLKAFLIDRSEWLVQTTAQWEPENADRIELWAQGRYHHVAEGIDLGVQPWAHGTLVSHTLEQLTEPTEDAYALWKVDAVIAPREGETFREPVAFLNGTQVECALQADGTALVSFAFEDLSYRPCDAYGEDIGLIYDYETYLINHPEVREICGDDPEAVLDYFLDEGTYLDHQGNAFFKPSAVLRGNPYLADYLGEDWQLYYWEYLAYGCSENWLMDSAENLSLRTFFEPKALPLP